MKRTILLAALILVLLGTLIFASACGKSDGEASENDTEAAQQDKYYTLSEENEQAFFAGLTEWINKEDIDEFEYDYRGNLYLTVSGHVYGVEKKRDISIVYYKGSESLYWSDGNKFFKAPYGAIEDNCAIARKKDGKYKILTVIELRDGALLEEDLEEVFPYKIRVLKENYEKEGPSLEPEGAQDRKLEMAKKHFDLQYGGSKDLEEK